MSLRASQGRTLTINETSDTLSSTSVLSWIQQLQTPHNSSYTPHLAKSPIRATKRCRSLGSTPSEFLGEGASYYKRLKISYEKTYDGEASEKELSDMGDNNIARLMTPSANASTSSASKAPSKAATASILTGVSSSSPHTPKRQKPNSNSDAIGWTMRLNGLLKDDKAFLEASEFRQYITDLVVSDRSSVMKPASIKRFNNHLTLPQGSNEATFLHYMIPILQGYGYHVAAETEFSQGEEEIHRNEAREWKEFLADEGIHGTLNQDFARTLLPTKFSETPGLLLEIARALEKDNGMTNPRPDITYGLLREKHELEVTGSIPQEIRDLLEITPGVHHAFLILEAKAPAGSDAQAQNQARRGGATLVKALRKLRTEIDRDITPPPAQRSTPGDGIQKSAMKGHSNPVTPDYTSFVFSITTSPEHFKIWVHWYDEANNKYHMNSVNSYTLINVKGPVEIRWALHNIMEWGARTRHDQNEALVKSIEDRIQRDMQRLQDATLAAQKQTKSARAAATAAKLAGKCTGSNSVKRSLPEDGEEDEV